MARTWHVHPSLRFRWNGSPPWHLKCCYFTLVFFWGGEFLQFSFMSVFNWKSPTHAEQPAKDLLSACIHAFVDEFQGNLAARNWKKGQRSWEFSLVAEIFGKSFEHHLSMVFCFLFDLILKKMIHDIFFYQFLHVASYWLHIFASQVVLVGSLPWFPKKTQVRPENLSLFRGTRIADVPPRQII